MQDTKLVVWLDRGGEEDIHKFYSLMRELINVEGMRLIWEK